MTTTTKAKFNCIEGIQSGHKLYAFFASAKELFQCVSINQKEEDADGGYQRAASPARTSAISRYIDAGNTLPLSILITLDPKSTKLDNGIIEINQKKSSGWVIDGQHRLIGAVQA